MQNEEDLPLFLEFDSSLLTLTINTDDLDYAETSLELIFEG